MHTPVNKHQYVITVNDLNVSKRHGIGGAGGGATIEIDAITKYETENRSSVRWYIEVQGERIEVTTQQLLDQRQLQKLVLKS